MFEFYTNHKDAIDLLLVVLGLGVPLLAFLRWVFLRNRPVQVTVANPEEIVPPPAKNIVQMDKHEFAAMTLKLRDEAIAEREKQHGTDRAILEEKIAELNRRLANPEEALAQQHAIIEDLRAQLKGSSNDPKFIAALEAFEKGEYTNADDIFAEIEAHHDLAVQESARAAFGRGEVAEAEVRWLDAAEHYKRSASLAPNFESLRLASAYLDRAGRSDQALEFSEALVRWSEKNEGPQRHAIALNECGLNQLAVGNSNDAETIFRKVLALDELTIGMTDPEYAVHLNNLSLSLHAQDRFDEAELISRKALSIDRDTIGEFHEDYAQHLNNLARTVHAKGATEEAEKLFRQAISVTLQTLGETHPFYGTRLNNLACLLRDQGDFSEARELFGKALKVLKVTLPVDHPNIAIVERHLANLPTHGK